VAELKVKSYDKDTRIVATAPNGDTVVEIRRGAAADGALARYQTKSNAWRVESAGKHTSAVRDASGATVAVIHHGRLGANDVELPSGENIKCDEPKLRMGYRYRFGELARAKAPFVAPQRHITLTVTDALLAREDRELLLAIATGLCESAISLAISVRANSPA
jgi:hypothetical protein